MRKHLRLGLVGSGLSLLSAGISACGAGDAPHGAIERTGLEPGATAREPALSDAPRAGEGSETPPTTMPMPSTTPSQAAGPASATSSADSVVALSRNPVPWAGSNERLALEDFADAFIAAGCQLLLDCRIGSGAQDAAFYGEVERCSVALRQHVGERLRAMQEAVQAGHFTYDEVGGAYCVRELALACGGIEALVPDAALDGLCASVFDGNVLPGGTCNSNEECRGDAICTSRTGCSGTCQPLIPLGGACTSRRDCSGFGYYGAFCDGTGRCAPIERKAPALLGEPCGPPFDLPQDGARVCAEGVCSGFRTAHEAWSLCSEPLTLAEPCPSGGSICEPGLYCNDDSAGAFTCQPRALATEVGVACDDATICDSLEHLHCEGGTCSLMGNGGENSWCLPGRQSGCREGMRCQWTSPSSGFCAQARVDGEACTDSSHCKSDRCRRMADGSGKCDSRYCWDAP